MHINYIYCLFDGKKYIYKTNKLFIFHLTSYDKK